VKTAKQTITERVVSIAGMTALHSSPGGQYAGMADD